jgi:hypothetical protein
MFKTTLSKSGIGHLIKKSVLKATLSKSGKFFFKEYLSKMVRSRGSLKSQTFLKETLIRLIWCLPCISQQVQIQEIA